MSEENTNDELVIIEERQRLVGYIDDNGNVCLRQEGYEPSATQIIYFDPDDAEESVIPALMDLRDMAKAHPVQVE